MIFKLSNGQTLTHNNKLISRNIHTDKLIFSNNSNVDDITVNLSLDIPDNGLVLVYDIDWTRTSDKGPDDYLASVNIAADKLTGSHGYYPHNTVGTVYGWLDNKRTTHQILPTQGYVASLINTINAGKEYYSTTTTGDFSYVARDLDNIQANNRLLWLFAIWNGDTNPIVYRYSTLKNTDDYISDQFNTDKAGDIVTEFRIKKLNINDQKVSGGQKYYGCLFNGVKIYKCATISDGMTLISDIKANKL